MSTATLTDLLRRPKDVIEMTGEDPVLITRRDGEDLVLMTAEYLENQQQGFELASKIIRAEKESGDLRQALCSLFPWTSLLAEPEIDSFASDIEKHLWSSISLGHYATLLNDFYSWEGTAESYAMVPRGSEVTWFDRPKLVPKP